MHDIAQMLRMAAGGQGGVASLYEGGADSAVITPATSLTSASLAIGTASSRRLVLALVAVGADNTGSTMADPTSVTIGGVSATKLASKSYAFVNHSIWAASVPTGTTATVSATLPALIFGYIVQAYALAGVIETPAYTASVTSNLSIGAVRNGMVIAVCSYQSSPNLSGAGGVVVAGSSGHFLYDSGRGTGFSLSYGAGQPAVTETITGSSTLDNLLAASFAPI